MVGGDAGKFLDIRLFRGNFAIDFSKEVRRRFSRRHRNHLAAASAVTKPMHRSCWQMHQCPRLGSHGFIADPERNVATHHVERFIPRMGVGRRSAAFRARLTENLISAGLCAGGEHCDQLADDIEGGWGRCRRYDKRFTQSPPAGFL